MAGFPYWPCFVTRSSDGDYIREAKNKISVHVQFFNWNDESGWVTKTMPWCSVAEFRRFAKEAIKEDVSCSMDWSPVGKMLHKWKNAALQAESTVHLSRKERHKRFLV
ncbi:MSH6 [Lepeophtheirus salmonis]|uniref:MSH6 n=2 Tax=Lepeophtheirus salmonis TaxID=72036 RepID=A0A7R8H3Z4_LEPSM|nr:MSH6 [Lepeophtheirus salmonis]CAF2842016.1 MSH6 [Lepeophtheirus salmonis]